MALSRPKDSIAQPSITVPGVATGGGASSQGVTASAGSDVQTASAGNRTLSGSASNGSSPYSYAWTLTTKPSSSSASITSSSSATATLTGIDKEGGYQCTLQVTDADSFVDTDAVMIDYAPAAVVSSAGSDVQTTSSSNRSLSGSGSGGTGTLSYAWSLVTKPSGSSASITSATSASATLTGIDNGGAYVCALTVTDSAATAISATDTVVIDYSAGQAAAWYELIDIDFTSATQGALTANSTTTVDGRDWWYRTPDASNTSATITSSGLEVDFAGTSNAGMRISTSVNSLLTKTSAGTVPRVRTTIVFSGMVLGTNTSYIGPCMSSFTRNNTVPGLPFIMGRYSRTGSGVYKYSVNARKGSSIGSNAASGSLNTSEVASDSNATSGCMELMDMGLGWFSFHGHDGNTTPTSGPDTFRGWVSISQSTQKDTTLSNVWDYGAGSGPFCGIHLRANGDNSEFVIIERIIVQEWR